jgi:hypothetical protein
MDGVIHIEVLLAVGYAVFLMAIAGALELAARYTHNRSARIRVAGFRYDPNFDLWTCPNGQKLFRAEADYGRNVVLYRATAHACNTCPMKTRCTDSNGGRTIELAPGSWLQSELRRFHRGMSLALFALAAIILLIEFFRYHEGFDRTLLAAVAIMILATGSRLGSTFLRGSDDRRY